VQPPSHNHLSELFFDCLKELEAPSGASTELIASIEQLGTFLSGIPKRHIWTANWDENNELGRGDLSVVRVARDPERTLTAVKTSETPLDLQLMSQKRQFTRN
jgi:hypothetical protein